MFENKKIINFWTKLDQILIEDVHAMGDLGVDILYNMLTLFFTHSTLPSELKTLIIAPLVKNMDGNVHSPGNYRPIALLSIIFKLNLGRTGR